LYRVVPAQLQARAGQVRCGRCMHVFDGFAALAGEQSGTAALEHPDRFRAEEKRAAESSSGAIDQRQGATDRPDKAAESPRLTPATVAAESAGTGVLVDEPAQSTARNGMRIAACVLLAALLAVQLAYTFRSQLAARSPAVRTILAGVCTVFACSVPLPHRPDLLKIEASDVHMLDPGRPGLIQLTTTLRSYADYDVAYPALDLVLTNATEHALARRIFLPAEYLDGTRDAEAGLPARAEITVALDLDTGNLNAAGFRVDLLAAPTP
jgi:predicted Zn finger-like uncharacterized protein